MRPKMRAASLAAGALCIALSASACAGAGGSGTGDPNSISVLMVNNPQMEDLQKLTADNFTRETGIKVNYTVLPENDVRAKISQEFSSQAGQYDVASLSNYEIPFFAANKWLAPLDSVAKDPEFNQADILPAYTASLT
ncbi:MAG TPA: extracellular solute-binding protein, partial [Arthrobacter sp.]|nr:extracellular solute-binding protein [Arthrobacter sp.]